MICTSSPPHPPKLRFQLKLDLIFTALMCNCAGELCQVGLENCGGCAEEEHMANASSLSGETAQCTLVCIILTRTSFLGPKSICSNPCAQMINSVHKLSSTTNVTLRHIILDTVIIIVQLFQFSLNSITRVATIDIGKETWMWVGSCCVCGGAGVLE